MEANKIKKILETEGAAYMLNQLFIDLVKENDVEKRHDIHKHNWDNVLDALKSYTPLPQEQREVPTDQEVKDWYDANIGNDPENPCSASSAIYKFRQWLKERESTGYKIGSLAIEAKSQELYPITNTDRDDFTDGKRVGFRKCGEWLLSRLPNQARVSDDEIETASGIKGIGNSKEDSFVIDMQISGAKKWIEGAKWMRDRPTGKEEEENFRIIVECSNCTDILGIRIDKGKLVEDEPCETCGCKTLEAVENRPEGKEGMLNMQHYMEYCQKNDHVTPEDWISKHKHF